MNTSDHRVAVAESMGKSQFEKAEAAAVEKELQCLKEKEKGIVALMKIIKFLADHSLPLSAFEDLVRLCRELGCSDLQVSVLKDLLYL